PRILPAGQLLAANGVEGTARPLLQIAAGPAVGGFLAGLAFPALAVVAIAVCHAAAFVLMMFLRIPTSGRFGEEEPQGSNTAPSTSILRDLVDGFLY
ncbi:MFS transporter, partial [Proteus mirabilis]|nr:MFS transporter [Proteus mirabilis]